MWLLFFVACNSCPEGLKRQGGLCVSDGTGEVAPLSEDNFINRYEGRACSQLEDCICDEFDDVDDCEVDCETPDWSWTEDCDFDLEMAELCLEGDWECDSSLFVVYAPDICQDVYICN